MVAGDLLSLETSFVWHDFPEEKVNFYLEEAFFDVYASTIRIRTQSLFLSDPPGLTNPNKHI